MRHEIALDHIVVLAPNLKAGVQWVRDVLGVLPHLGGRHERMGTHNCLLALGNGTYLEVLAPDPNAPEPNRARWFGLDQLGKRFEPRVGAWVARTQDIRASIAACGEQLGDVEPMARGELEWLISVTGDGMLPLDGCAPILIQWQTGVHPAATMSDSGCTLQRLDLYHRHPARVRGLMQCLGIEDARITVRPTGSGMLPRLEALIRTPAGDSLLSSAT